MADTSSISVSTAQWVKNSPYITLSVTKANTSNSASYVYDWKLTYTAKYAASTSQNRSYSVTIGGVTSSGTFSINNKTGTHTVASGTRTIARTRYTQTITASASFAFNLNWSGVYAGTKSVSKNVTIDPKPSYMVTYNLAGGVGTFNNQTKWYNDSLTLYSTKPSRTGYDFLGWFVNNTGSAAVSYTSNSPATIYARWKESLQKPTITNLIIKRCTETGVVDEVNGTYAKASFNWSVDPNYSLESLTIDEIEQQTPTTSHVETSPFTITGGFLTDHSYDIDVTITDSARQTLTVTGILSSSKYPIDVRAGGDGVTIGGVAETTGFRVLMSFTPMKAYTKTQINNIIFHKTGDKACLSGLHPNNRAVLCKMADNLCFVNFTMMVQKTIPAGYFEVIELPDDMRPLGNGALFAESATNPSVNIVAYARVPTKTSETYSIMLRLASSLELNTGTDATTEVTVFGFYFTDANEE